MEAGRALRVSVVLQALREKLNLFKLQRREWKWKQEKDLQPWERRVNRGIVELSVEIQRIEEG